MIGNAARVCASRAFPQRADKMINSGNVLTQLDRLTVRFIAGHARARIRKIIKIIQYIGCCDFSAETRFGY